MSDTTARCADHPQRPAEFECEACGARLCPDCVREGHRLLFCGRCGERALPLGLDVEALERGASVQELERVRVEERAATYRYRDALLYPFRGSGATAFWGYFALYVGEALVLSVPAFGILLAVPIRVVLFLVAILFPAFLFKMARTTFRGEDELPDWPAMDLPSNVAEFLIFLCVQLVSLLPLAALAYGFGCHPWRILTAGADASGCVPALLFGIPASVALWIPAFASVAVFESGWAWMRLDLHFLAIREDLGELSLAVGMLVAVLLAGFLLPLLLPLPGLVGTLLARAASLWAWFTGAHLAGVYFRRHPRAMRRIYLGR